MERAYSAIEVKAFDDTEDMFFVEGMASTPTPDRMNDVVDPMGAQFKTPMPLLWQHDHGKPVGHVTFAKPDKKGIPFKAEIPKIQESGTLKDRIDEAIQSLKYKLVAAVSIGFRPLEDGYQYMENGGIEFKQWEWLELSLVTIPANPEARIQIAKSIDKSLLAALGKTADSDYRSSPPGVAGKRATRPIQLIPRR